MWILEWIGWLELPEVEGDDDDDDDEEEEKRGRIVTRSHLEPPRQQCSAVYAPAEAKQWSNQCFYQRSPLGLQKRSVWPSGITLFGKEVRQAGGEEQ